MCIYYILPCFLFHSLLAFFNQRIPVLIYILYIHTYIYLYIYLYIYMSCYTRFFYLLTFCNDDTMNATRMRIETCIQIYVLLLQLTCV